MRLEQRPGFSRLEDALIVDRDRIVVPNLNDSFPDDRFDRQLQPC
jgi:hypothetical protein